MSLFEVNFNALVFFISSCEKVNFLLTNDKTHITFYSSLKEIYFWVNENEKIVIFNFASISRHHRHQLPPLVQGCLHENFDNINHFITISVLSMINHKLSYHIIVVLFSTILKSQSCFILYTLMRNFSIVNLESFKRILYFFYN